MSHPAFDLSGKTAVVIGGTSGIGRAIARGLAEAGADVVPSSRRLEQVKKLLLKSARCADVRWNLFQTSATEASLSELLDKCVSEFGKVDILINSAGKTKRTPSIDVGDEEWAEILDTNLNGTLRACQIFGRHMLQRNYGRIVNIASLSSFVALHEVAATRRAKLRWPC